MQKIYFFLSNALKSFAEMQKGFYCSICDAEYNQYFAVQKEDKIVNFMSANFCAQVVNIFREFLYYKVNYIDPMILNANFLMNCYYNTDEYEFNFNYNIPLKNINNCIYSGGAGKDCINVCEEFKVG